MYISFLGKASRVLVHLERMVWRSLVCIPELPSYLHCRCSNLGAEQGGTPGTHWCARVFNFWEILEMGYLGNLLRNSGVKPMNFLNLSSSLIAFCRAVQVLYLAVQVFSKLCHMLFKTGMLRVWILEAHCCWRPVAVNKLPALSINMSSWQACKL